MVASRPQRGSTRRKPRVWPAAAATLSPVAPLVAQDRLGTVCCVGFGRVFGAAPLGCAVGVPLNLVAAARAVSLFDDVVGQKSVRRRASRLTSAVTSSS